MSQSTRQSQTFDQLAAKQLTIGESQSHCRDLRLNALSDTELTESQSGVIVYVARNGLRVTLPTRPRAGTTFKIRNTISPCTFVIALSQEDSFFGGNIRETPEGTSLRCLQGEIGDEVTFVADGIDGYVITSLIGSKWSPIKI